MPTILFLNKSPPYRHTGAETILWAVATNLARHGWDVHFLCPDGEDAPSVENITFHEVDTPESFFTEKAMFFIKGAPQFWRVKRKIEPDIVYDNSSPLPFPYAYALDSDRVVTKVHALYGRSAFLNKHHPLTKVGTYLGEHLYRLMDGSRMIAISESTKARLSKIVKKNHSDITVNRNGIPVEEFEYDFSPDGPVLSLCELTPRKNIDTLLRAWHYLELNGYADRELVIAGDGPSRENLEELTSKLDLKSVTFRGYVPRETKLQLLREASVYVLPTRIEGFGLSNLEAMASGCLVVSTDAPGVRDYINDGSNGFSVPVEDPGALAFKLMSTLEDIESLESVAHQGRQTAETYHIDDTGERERQILERLLYEMRH